ncbi:MAG: DUF1415 domain-containing protein [Phycisphaerae bacterium]|mgnify:CR=1 FL=1|nr:DUF1415 domain-containing protein [Phycisphaerales bacterium]
MSMLSRDARVMKVTEKWVKTVVVDHEFCPFAGRVLEAGSIAMRVLEQCTDEACCDAMLDELRGMDGDEAIETTLLILINSHRDFEEYLDLIGYAESFLESNGYDDVYQLASFHPDYCFVDSSPDDAANYTNRSPFPMIHILRADSVEKAIEQHPDTMAIPERNIRVARELGVDTFKALLDQCWLDESGNRLEI